MNDEPKFAIPPRLMVDGDGYCWREFDPTEDTPEGILSMCPVNPNNEPIPEPRSYYVPVSDPHELPDLDLLRKLVEALTEIVDVCSEEPTAAMYRKYGPLRDNPRKLVYSLARAALEAK